MNSENFLSMCCQCTRRKASTAEAVQLDSILGQVKEYKVDIHSFPA